VSAAATPAPNSRGAASIPTSDAAAVKRAIAERAKAEGFDAFGVAAPAAPGELAIRLSAFLGAGLHGRMDWLARRAHWRGDPKAMWPAAQSAIVLGLSYAPNEDPLAALAERSRGVISVYAQGADYHDVLKVRLKRIAGFIAERTGAEVKVFVDTAPVMEKPLAARAGLVCHV
jgi:epoxyqueuosine reductase